MTRDIDEYFMQQPEPVKSHLLSLRHHLLSFDENITEEWKYKMPFYYFKGKMFCYLWTRKQSNVPYVGFVDGKLLQHPDLVIEKRSRMKIFIMDPEKDIPIKKINAILKEARKLRDNSYRFRSASKK
jgi:hypothetical protein